MVTMAYYVYRVTHIQEQKHYIGSRGCQGLAQDDLGRCYFTSSVILAPLFREHPEHFKTKILRCCETRQEALAFERKCHLRLDVVKHPAFYNQANAGEKFVASGPQSEEHKRKIGAANKGKKRPDLITRNKLQTVKGVPKSEEHKKKLREAAILRWSNPENRKAQSSKMTERCADPEVYRKRSESQIRRWSDPLNRERQSEALTQSLHKKAQEKL